MKSENQSSDANQIKSLVFLVGVTFLISLRTIDTANLWWDLSRGREVVAGSATPSKALLSLDVHSEADWLSGLPFYVLWNTGGVFLLAAVPVLAAIVLMLYSRSNLGLQGNGIAFLCLFPLLLWSVRDGLQPSPQLFDILGMLAVAYLIHSQTSQRRKGIGIFCAFLIWANLGPSPIWGLALLICFGSTSTFSQMAEISHIKARNSAALQNNQSPTLRWLSIAFLAGLCTPRGISTWSDSLILQSPKSFSNIELYYEQGWQIAWFHDSWLTSEWSFLILWCVWCGAKLASIRIPVGDANATLSKWSLPVLQRILIVIFPLLAALLARKNIPLCGIWILVDVIHAAQAIGMNHNNQRPVFASRQTVGYCIASLLFCAVCIDAFGYGVEPHRRLGFGISRELDLRLFDSRLLAVTDESVVGWAPDGRSVGIVTWYSGNVIMADHPQRALLGKRLPESTRLIEDLLGARRAKYRRDDGTWGGWVRLLADWNVSMLLIPVEMPAVIGELSRTPWQQVDFDSPSVPFVSSNEPEFTPFILEASQQQGFVEFGPWRPTLDIYGGMGWRFDMVELAGLGVDHIPAIHQSQIFRAANIPMASLRAMLPVRVSGLNGPLKAEFLACQIDLAYQEWFSFGESSLFRRLVIAEMTDRSLFDNQPWCHLEPEEVLRRNENWARCISDYISGDIQQAVNSLSGDTSSERFSRAMLHLELGDIQSALFELKGVKESPESDSTFIAASYWRQQIEQFSGQ